ncbi:MAG TPA: hypothetical protein VJB99_02580 [Patescibacteria group bacterium]|nr:hypothetical protein [Patescibacteria group bacterium]
MLSRTPKFDAKITDLLNAVPLGERTCSMTGETWTFDQEHLDWCRRLQVPPSSISPKTRVKILLGFATGIALWKKTHAWTGEPILSCVHPDSPYQIITDKEWHAFDPSEPSGELDPNQSILPQIERLAYSIPVPALCDTGTNANTVGVDLVNAVDCYMGFGGLDMKRLMYFSVGTGCEDSVDLTNNYSLRESFSSNHCERLFRCQFTFESRDCLNTAFLFDCRNCEFCFGAVNQRNKKYLWFHEQLSKEEWERRRARADLRSFAVFREWVGRFRDFIEKEAVWPENFNVGSEDSTGDYLSDCLRCHKGFWQKGSRDCFWSPFNEQCEGCSFVVWAGHDSDSYSSNVFACQGMRCCSLGLYSRNLEYCFLCVSCEDCFGCVGLKHKRFHIFNRPYSEEEYWKRVDEIKTKMLERGEYGMIFSAAMSLMGFPFSAGDSFHGYTELERKQFGIPDYDVTKGSVINPDGSALRSEDIPDHLDHIDPSRFVGKPIYDSQAKRFYSVTPQEFTFYQRHRLPFPRQHFLSRLKNLFVYCNGPFAEESSICESCGKSLLVHPNRQFSKRRILCEVCYLAYLEKNG